AMSSEDLAIAAGLARESSHPLARALSATLQDRGLVPAGIDHITEHPGHGIEAMFKAQLVRLGNRSWCGAPDAEAHTPHQGPELCLRIAGKPTRVFCLEDDLRADAADTVTALKARGLRVMLLSGDRAGAVEQAAKQTGIDEFYAGWKPLDKAAFVQSLQAAGHKVLMIGDGINDAPALGSAHASIAPSTAADIAGTTAGFVFLGSRLQVVVDALETAVAARRLVRQNFAFAALYNLIAVPIAIAGLASPLIAALAMSGSSLVVTVNALRLRLHPLARGRSQ
ncbi:MAG: heavy metal translocating P-type ATPase, partial [Aestuariivirgaceae bacterium]